MLRLNTEKLMRRLALLTVLLSLVVCFQSPTAAVLRTQSQGPIKDGVGIGGVEIGVSTAADIEARHGTKYQLINKNDYSYRMEYADLGLAFYYCYKDEKKRVFLVEALQGVTGKGIVVGKSTLKDVLKLYGEQKGVSHSYIYEYEGIQFYLAHDWTPEGEKEKAPTLDSKVVEVDLVPPDKSSNFCD